MKTLFITLSAAKIASLEIGDYILGKVDTNKWIAAKVIKLGRKYITGQYYDKEDDQFEESEAYRIDAKTFNRLKLTVVTTKEAKSLEQSAEQSVESQKESKVKVVKSKKQSVVKHKILPTVVVVPTVAVNKHTYNFIKDVNQFIPARITEEMYEKYVGLGAPYDNGRYGPSSKGYCLGVYSFRDTPCLLILTESKTSTKYLSSKINPMSSDSEINDILIARVEKSKFGKRLSYKQFMDERKEYAKFIGDYVDHNKLMDKKSVVSDSSFRLNSDLIGAKAKINWANKVTTEIIQDIDVKNKKIAISTYTSRMRWLPINMILEIVKK